MVTTQSTLTAPAKTLEEVARYLADVNYEYGPAILCTYWFEDSEGSEIRLVHIDPNTSGAYEKVSPFYFGASVDQGVFLPKSAIALVRPEDEKRLALPTGWGDWASATVWEQH